MFDIIEDMFGLAVLEEFFGKFDFLGIIEVLKAFEACETYVALGETVAGVKLIVWSMVFFAFRVALTILATIFILRVWKIVSYHYFKILDEEKNKEVKKQFFARKDKSIENTVTPKEKKAETVKDEEFKKTKEIEIPTAMDATKEVELSKQIKKPKGKTTLKEKIIKFLFNEE